MVLKNVVVPALATVGFLFLITETLANFFDSPVVYKNHLNGKCVAIESSKGLSDCKVIPKKYDVLYVEPGVTYSTIKAYRKRS